MTHLIRNNLGQFIYAEFVANTNKFKLYGGKVLVNADDVEVIQVL